MSNVEAQPIIREVVKTLIANLSKAQIIELASAIDGGATDELLDLLNEHLEKVAPEVFAVWKISVKGEFYAEFDENTGMHCVFHTDVDNHAFASYAGETEAIERAANMNVERQARPHSTLILNERTGEILEHKAQS